MCEENVEYTHDRREEIAMSAIMNAVASRGKGKNGTIPNLKELYNRDSEGEKESMEDIVAKQEEAINWLSNKTIVNK